MNEQIYKNLSPCNIQHQYIMSMDQSYNVTAQYCLVSANGDALPGTCDQYSRIIDVSEF